MVDNVLVYDADRLREARARDEEAVAAELVRALTDGPGVVAIHGAFPDTDVVDRVTSAFEAIIAEERASGRPGRRPLREGRCERPRVERAGEAGRA